MLPFLRRPQRRRSAKTKDQTPSTNFNRQRPGPQPPTANLELVPLPVYQSSHPSHSSSDPYRAYDISGKDIIKLLRDPKGSKDHGLASGTNLASGVGISRFRFASAVKCIAITLPSLISPRMPLLRTSQSLGHVQARKNEFTLIADISHRLGRKSETKNRTRDISAWAKRHTNPPELKSQAPTIVLSIHPTHHISRHLRSRPEPGKFKRHIRNSLFGRAREICNTQLQVSYCLRLFAPSFQQCTPFLTSEPSSPETSVTLLSQVYPKAPENSLQNSMHSGG